VLTIIPTPIGNLKDITLRALDALRDCDLILCEDTRRTLQLLSAYDISKKILRYSDHLERTVEQGIGFLLEGKKVCLVSDGGMPCISDPGWKIINRAREMDIKVEILPGPSAVTAALAGSGFPADSFVFLGFLPRSGGKIVKNLKNALALEKPVALYESPYRLKRLLGIIEKKFPALKITVARELSKTFEEWIRGDAKSVLEKLKDREVKGEVTVVLYAGTATQVSGPRSQVSRMPEEDEKKLLFVCTGNTCRSVMAQYYAGKLAGENSGLEISSAGLYANPRLETPAIVKKLLKEEGVAEFTRVPRQLTLELAENSDPILAMTKEQKELLLGYFPDLADRIFTVMEYGGLGNADIADPYGQGDLQYGMVFRTLKNGVKSVLEKLKKAG